MYNYRTIVLHNIVYTERKIILMSNVTVNNSNFN